MARLYAGLASVLSIGLTALAAAGMVPVQAAEPQSNLVFILDGSGSMWGRIQKDEMKISAAKAVMDELLRDVPANVDIGFVSYGHRREGDCGDIETLAGLGSPPGAVAEAIRGITPRGKTPITDSLRHAASLLGAADRPSTIVLVSDGIETCKGDPCALAKELRAGGIDLVIHTVGFGVGDEAAAQLQCVAEAGGGHYYHTASAEQLRKALFSVREAVAHQEPAPEPPAPPEPAETKTASKKVLKIGPATLRLKPASWVKMPVEYWKVLDAESGEEKGKARDDAMRVRAGEYRIAWRQSQHGHRMDVPLSEVVSVGPGESVEVPIDTGIRLIVPETVEPPYRWWLQRPGEADKVAEFAGTLDPQVVPAGTYRLGWYQRQHASSWIELGTVEIEPGKLNDVVMDHGLVVTAAEWVPGAPEAYRLIDDAGDVISAWEFFGTQLAPSGTYRFEYQQSQHGHSSCPWGEVTVPEDEFLQLPINTGVRFNASEDTPLPYRIYFVNLDLGEECVWKGPPYNSAWQPIPLPPGRYRLDWWDDQRAGDRITILEEFTIEPNTLVEFDM